MDNPVIAEIEGYEGEDGQIVVENFRAERIGMGRPNIIDRKTATGGRPQENGGV